MTWYSFWVDTAKQAEIVAENLLTLALDPVSLSLISPDVQVYRRRRGEGELFFFSPAAYLFFKPFVATYHGAPCERPVATHDQPELRRLSLKSQTFWLPIPPGVITREDGDFPH